MKDDELTFPTAIKTTPQSVVPEPPDLPDLKRQALEVLESAKLIKIESVDQRFGAEAFITLTTKQAKRYKDLLNPGIESARSTLNLLKSQRDEILDPIAEAKQIVNIVLSDWYQKERVEKRRLQNIEDKRLAKLREDERKALADVAEAEKNGDMEKADQILEKQAAKEIEVITAPVTATAPPPEKMKGISERMIPKWEITDVNLLPEKFRTIIPIRPKITGLIRSLGPKEAMRLCPGIKAWEEPSITVRG